MKQHAYKPYKKPPECPVEHTRTASKSAKKKKPKKKPMPLEQMGRKELIGAMNWEHPLVSLNVGTVATNVKGVLHTNEDLAIEVQRCLSEAVRYAAIAKRSCQVVLGRYIEHIFISNEIEELDRGFLDGLCERLSPNTMDDDEALDATQSEDHQDQEESNNYQRSFISILMRSLYSERLPDAKGSKAAQAVNNFIRRLQQLGILDDTITGSKINKSMPYPATQLLRSVSTQLNVELRK
ncbi:hypothetical protein BGZ76_007414, partial [Entomortierella beljakovae]